MTGHYRAAVPVSPRPHPPRSGWVVAIAYVLCWIVGLLIGGPALEPAATAAEVEQAFAGSGSVLVFAALVHGVAAGLLVALGRSLAAAPLRTAAVTASWIAAVLSIGQLVGEVALIGAPGAVDASLVWQLVTRVDGIKMLALAALIIAVHRGRIRDRVTLTVVSAAAVIALLVSGSGYIGLEATLMQAATASLPLLLIWALVATAARRPAPRETAA